MEGLSLFKVKNLTRDIFCLIAVNDVLERAEKVTISLYHPFQTAVEVNVQVDLQIKIFGQLRPEEENSFNYNN